ncbi:MAG TPA: hypothetical protein VMW74_03625 [Nitrosopumilaceae archaeon]|nr:hypothetical protein [Nitrosopumilaceae archaeon]
MMSQFEPKETSFERERAILEEIRKNPNLHHNALIKLMVPKYMAKTTFEKTKNHMLEKNVLSVTKRGNKNFYHITENYQKKSLQMMERITHENYQRLQHEIKRIKDHQHIGVNEKISTCVQLLRELLSTDNGFTILDSVKNPKKTLYKDEHLSIQEMISKVFEIIIEDRDFELIYPVVMKYVKIDTSNDF